MELSEPLKEDLIRKKIEAWEKAKTEKDPEKETELSTLTVSVQPGSGGTDIAARLAEKLGYELFDRFLVDVIAESVEISRDVVQTVEKERLHGIEDFISSLIDKQYLHPGIYLRHLMNVVHVIASHGRAVIVGRGANFILPFDMRFSIRVVAPEETRIQNIMTRFNISEEEAKHRIFNRQSKRTAFVCQSFHRDINDPLAYDMVVNTEKMDLETAARGIHAFYRGLITDESK
jgi:cytidylate kinase